MLDTERILYIKGELKTENVLLNGKLKTNDYKFKGVLSCKNMILEGNLMVGGDMLPWYDGEYEVTPKVEKQRLYTAQKSMATDVSIKKIPIVAVTNPSGGNTVTIGGEF